MASVNDLPRLWSEGEHGGDSIGKTYLHCAWDLQETARSAWKPVSEPPTQNDAEPAQCALGTVLVFWRDNQISMEDWDDVAAGLYEGMTHWARVRDVVLLPEGEGE